MLGTSDDAGFARLANGASIADGALSANGVTFDGRTAVATGPPTEDVVSGDGAGETLAASVSVVRWNLAVAGGLPGVADRHSKITQIAGTLTAMIRPEATAEAIAINFQGMLLVGSPDAETVAAAVDDAGGCKDDAGAFVPDLDAACETGSPGSIAWSAAPLNAEAAGVYSMVEWNATALLGACSPTESGAAAPVEAPSIVGAGAPSSTQ